MLGTAEFYKSTPKIMPRSSKTNPVAKMEAISPVPKKKRRVRRTFGGILVEKNARHSGQLELKWRPDVCVTKLPSWAASSGSGFGTSLPSLHPDFNTAPSTMKTEDKEPQPSQRTSERIRTLRSSNIKKESLAVKQELEEEDEEEAELVSDQESGGDDSSSDSDSDVENGELSAYEKKRLQNIEENALFFASLGISKTKEKLLEHSTSTAVQKASTRGLKPVKRVIKKAELPHRPRSLRLRRIDPEGRPLPYVPAPLVIEEPVYEQESRKPPGPLEMEPVNITSKGGEKLLAPLCKTITGLSNSPKGTATAHPQDLATFKETVQSMRLVPEHVAKVTRDRIFSVNFHPSLTKIIICAGDKWGKVGVWDVESQEGDDGVYLFQPHSRPVSCLKFAPANPTKLFSCSYDGTARCGDFEKGVFDEISYTDESDDRYFPHFDFLSADGTKLLLGVNQQQGHVQVIDSRQKRHSSGPGFWLHDRLLKTVHVRPTNENHFVTSSNNGTVALWDLRTLKEQGRCKSISVLPHGRSVSSAYFSPLTGNKIVTTAYDDQIRILNVNESGKLDIERSIRHDNHTGRWLTTFRTVWHPRREDVILVGSMQRPRRIDVLDINGHLLHSPRDADNLASVCSITVWHPHRDIISGGNASGRLHVFM